MIKCQIWGYLNIFTAPPGGTATWLPIAMPVPPQESSITGDSPPETLVSARRFQALCALTQRCQYVVSKPHIYCLKIYVKSYFITAARDPQ